VGIKGQRRLLSSIGRLLHTVICEIRGFRFKKIKKIIKIRVFGLKQIKNKNHDVMWQRVCHVAKSYHILKLEGCHFIEDIIKTEDLDARL
jgi:hypothetical protein